MTGMDTSTETERIRAEATRWFVLLHENPADDAPRRQFETWRDADPRHAETYLRLQRLWGAAGHLPSMAKAPANATRRNIVAGGIVVTALAGGAARLALGPHPLADHTTGKGEVRRVALADGSTVQLSSSTALNTTFDAGRRFVELLAGEAFFELKEEARPFQVKAGSVMAMATDAAFAVSRRSGVGQVTVLERGVRLAAGTERLTLDEGRTARVEADGTVRTAPADMNQLAWRGRRLVFVAKPLEDVVSELNRWTSKRVVLLGEAVARRPVTLMIGIDEADDALARIAEVVPMRLMRLTSAVTVVLDA